TAAVDEELAGARHLLEDEALAAEEAGAQPLGERDAEVDVARRAEERVALAQQGLLPREGDVDDLARIRPGERNLRVGARAPEIRDEQALPGEPLARQSAEQYPLHLRVHLYPDGPEHHRAALRAASAAPPEHT